MTIGINEDQGLESPSLISVGTPPCRPVSPETSGRDERRQDPTEGRENLPVPSFLPDGVDRGQHEVPNE